MIKSLGQRVTRFKVGLLGLGTVGSGVAEIFLDPAKRHPLLQSVEIHRVGVKSLEKPRNISPALLTTDLESIVTDPDIDIVVEVIGGLEPARSLMLMAIAHGKHVVTANKAAIARHGDELFTAANAAGVYVLLEAAVGGGIPVIQPLKQSLGANRLRSVIGIVNGTTNYILTRMQTEGADFAEVLADAQQLGYAEADPTADVDGFDARDKVAILASLAFGERLNLTDIPCEGIRQVSATDITYAAKLGFVIKLLAIATNAEGSLSVRVHPTLVPMEHPLASVHGVYNAILVEGEPIGQVMFFGPGAGSGPTASAVVADILNIVALLNTHATDQLQPHRSPVLHPLLSCPHNSYATLAPLEGLNTRFYARLLAQDYPGVIGKIGTCFGDHQVSLESIVQAGLKHHLAEIVVVTHDVQEGNFRKALAEIQHLEAISSIPTVLRVLGTGS
jgi:homoserine dehydrogenase